MRLSEKAKKLKLAGIVSGFISANLIAAWSITGILTLSLAACSIGGIGALLMLSYSRQKRLEVSQRHRETTIESE